MLDFSKPFIIVSHETPDKSEKQRTYDGEQLQGIAKLNGYRVIPVEGTWQGQKEQSYLIYGRPNKTGWSLFELGELLAGIYYQNSFLVWDTVEAGLYNCYGTKLVTLGQPVPATETEDKTTLPNGESFTFKQTTVKER